MISRSSLFLKRHYFKDEREFRFFIIYDKMCSPTVVQKIRIDPNSLFDSIVIDPRVPKEQSISITKYLKNLDLTKQSSNPNYLKSPKLKNENS